MPRVFLCFVLVGLAVATRAEAQSNGRLANLVPSLILEGITLPGADDPGRPHAGHFTLGNPTFGGSQGASQVDQGAKLAVAAFGDRLRAQFANVPLGSSTGGFTYTFDAATGAYTRSTPSFGPAFTERATTIGRQRFSLGFNYQRSTFDTFGGENLRDASITFYLPHTDCCNPANPPPSPLFPFFEGDVMEAALTLRATSDTFAVIGNYGVTDRFDLGFALPISRVALDANVRATILRLATANTPLVHTFVEGQDVAVQNFRSSGSATGLGDIILRTKYNLVPAGTQGFGNSALSLLVDLRLPTGDEEELLGIGTTQGKFGLVVSSGGDRIAPHASVGYTISGKGQTDPLFDFVPVGASDELSYAGGIEIVARPNLTILADVLGRTLLSAGTLQLETRSFQFMRAGSTTLETSASNPLTGQPYQQLSLLRDNHLNLLLGSTGFKFNPTGNLLVGANILFPLNNAGLRDRLTFSLGFDYAF